MGVIAVLGGQLVDIFAREQAALQGVCESAFKNIRALHPTFGAQMAGTVVFEFALALLVLRLGYPGSQRVVREGVFLCVGQSSIRVAHAYGFGAFSQAQLVLVLEHPIARCGF
ncbi:hypothetical protein D9M71_762300 [compost metagenome]